MKKQELVNSNEHSKTQVRFSIRFKFLGVMTILLVACVSVYLLIAVHVFKTDKTELVFDLNRSQVSNLASELETQFVGVSDKFKLFAVFSQSQKSLDWVESLFSEDSDVVFVSMFKNQQQTDSIYQSKVYLETYGLKPNHFSKNIMGKNQIPFAEIQKNGVAFWNANQKDGSPLIGFGRSVLIEDKVGKVLNQMAVVGLIKADRFSKAMSLAGLSEIKIVNKNGEILLPGTGQVESGLFQKALEGKTKTSVLKFSEKNEKFLGAYSKSFQNQIYVLAKASEAKAFSAVTQLIERSLIFSLIILTAAFLAAILLSRSLTQPLRALVDRMEDAAFGDLSTQISISSQDETALLAKSFNQMMSELKNSRDKLEEINRDLDAKVKERTLQLEEQNRAVKEAQEALLRTTRLASVGEIAGRAAHEVLNPLTSLLTRVGIMERKIKTEIQPQLTVFSEIQSAWKEDFKEGGFEKLIENWQKPSQVKSGLNLWQEDLDNLNQFQTSLTGNLSSLQLDTEFLSKEGGRINKIIDGMRKLSVTSSEKRIHSMHEVLKECQLIMADLFEQSACKIKLDLTNEPDFVEIDRDEMIQAITNLMRNSLQAMNEAKGFDDSNSGFTAELKVITQKEGSHFKVLLQDNGVGISPENQAKLFQTQFSTKSREQGTGLGLGISRRFIRSSGGDIEFVSSEPLVKTVFMIRIPCSEKVMKVAV